MLPLSEYRISTILGGGGGAFNGTTSKEKLSPLRTVLPQLKACTLISKIPFTKDCIWKLFVNDWVVLENRNSLDGINFIFSEVESKDIKQSEEGRLSKEKLNIGDMILLVPSLSYWSIVVFTFKKCIDWQQSVLTL